MSTLHVIFKVGTAEYGLPASEVLQMESFSAATEVPGAAPYVAGLVQIRGQVIPVVDLRVRFGLPRLEPTLDSRVLVVRAGERRVGLLADSAREMLRINDQDFHPPPELLTQQADGFVSSIAQVGPRLILLINFDQVIGHTTLPKENSHGEA